MEMKIKRLTQAQWAELLLISGIGLFIGGTMCYIAGYLKQEQITPIAAMALLFVGAGSSKKQMQNKKVK